MITEQQYQRLMKEYAKTGVQGTAAMKAGMHRGTAAKYLLVGHGPQPEKKRGRRRPDPLKTIWPAAERLLIDAPELEAKALFEHLLAKSEAPQAQRALRTFQRRVLGWRRRYGPPREVFFPQAREPGASLQLDWTHAAELGSLSFPDGSGGHRGTDFPQNLTQHPQPLVSHANPSRDISEEVSQSRRG